MAEKTKELTVMGTFKNNLEKQADNIWSQRAAYLAIERRVWLEKAMLYVAGNDYLLETMKTRDGQLGVLRCMFAACNLGLVFGGMFPEAHIVPFKGVPTLIPTAVGLKNIALSDPKVINGIRFAIIHKNESCRLDYAGGQVIHGFDPIKYDGERGESVGAYAVVKTLENEDVITYMGKKEIEKIRDKAQSYIAYKAGKIKSSPWVEFPDEMWLKTVVKKALKPFVSEKDARVRAINGNDQEHGPAINIDEYKEMSIHERAVNGIPTPPPEEPVEKTDPVIEPVEDKAGEEGQDLFS